MNQNNIIEPLLRKYLNNRLTPDEAVALKELMCRIDSKEIDEILSRLWAAYESPGEAPKGVREQIFRNLRKTFLPKPRYNINRTIWRSVAAVFICLMTGLSAYLYIYRG